MNLNIAILTGNRVCGQQLQRLLQSQPNFRTTVIDIDSGLSSRQIATPEILLLNRDLNREQINRVATLFHHHIDRLRMLVIVSEDVSLESIFEYLRNDVRAIVLDREKASDLIPALTQIVGGNMFLSPKITMRLIHRLQELRARLSDLHGR